MNPCCLRILKQSFFCLILAVFSSVSGTLIAGEEPWVEFSVDGGNYSVLFPQNPQQVQQFSQVEGQPMRYELYLSTDLKEAVYFVLVAEYPFSLQGVEEDFLEGFVQGFLQGEEDFQLLSKEKGEGIYPKSVDFFLQSAEDHYFKGRVIVADRKVYLLGVQSEREAFSLDSYNRFISSFNSKIISEK